MILDLTKADKCLVHNTLFLVAHFLSCFLHILNYAKPLDRKNNYGQASYTDWLHFEKCTNVTNQGTILTVVSPINVQCLSVYTDKHCTLIGDISK